MRIFVAGATGVLGRTAVRALVDAGHEVTGIARMPEKARQLAELGAETATVDLFDAAMVRAAVDGHETVCNFATHIPASPLSYWRRSAWRTNDRLHGEASRHLVDAAIETGARRYLQHSVAFQYADGGAAWLDEDARVQSPPHGLAVLAAEAEARRFSDAGGCGIAMRFGFFYGPDAKSARDLLRIARLGFVPMVGRAGAYVSWIHTSDLGTSVVAALGAPAGVYNVVDDDPLQRRELGEVLAARLARKRLRLPPRIASSVLGKRYEYIQRSQRVSNARFKRAAAWSPSVPSSRTGWASMFVASTPESIA